MVFEFNMTKAMANEILKSRKGEDKRKDPQEYLVKYVNEEMGLLHEVNKVYTTL